MPFSPLFLFAFVFLLPHREVQSGDSSAMMTRDEGKTSICFSLASETRKTKSASLKKKKKKKKRTQTRRAMRIRSRAEWCFSYASSTSMMMLRMKTSVFPPVLHRWYHAYAYHHRDRRRRRRRLGERARGFVPFFSLLKLEDSSQ